MEFLMLVFLLLSGGLLKVSCQGQSNTSKPYKARGEILIWSQSLNKLRYHFVIKRKGHLIIALF